jgi:hypothetical protein
MRKMVSEGNGSKHRYMPMQPRVAPPKKRSGSMPCGKMNDAEPMRGKSQTMMGFVASSSIEPKYAAPPANPARTHGMVIAYKSEKKK